MWILASVHSIGLIIEGLLMARLGLLQSWPNRLQHPSENLWNHNNPHIFKVKRSNALPFEFVMVIEVEFAVAPLRHWLEWVDLNFCTVSHVCSFPSAFLVWEIWTPLGWPPCIHSGQKKAMVLGDHMGGQTTWIMTGLRARKTGLHWMWRSDVLNSRTRLERSAE